MWAVGCIGYELCMGKKLGENNEALKDYIHDAKQNQDAIRILLANILPRFSQLVRGVIRECLKWNPKERCTAEQVQDYLSAAYEQLGNV